MNWTPEQYAEHMAAYTRKGGSAIAAPEPEVIQDLRPEWMFEAECTKLLEEDGWRALRTDPVSDRGRGKGFGELGMADHLYLRYPYRFPQGHLVDGMNYPEGYSPHARANAPQVLWIEFKSAKGKPQKHQLAWHQKERARGALTWIAGVDFPASVDGFRAHYANSGLKRRQAVGVEVTEATCR